MNLTATRFAAFVLAGFILTTVGCVGYVYPSQALLTTSGEFGKHIVISNEYPGTLMFTYVNGVQQIRRTDKGAYEPIALKAGDPPLRVLLQNFNDRGTNAHVLVKVYDEAKPTIQLGYVSEQYGVDRFDQSVEPLVIDKGRVNALQ